MSGFEPGQNVRCAAVMEAHATTGTDPGTGWRHVMLRLITKDAADGAKDYFMDARQAYDFAWDIMKYAESAINCNRGERN